MKRILFLILLTFCFGAKALAQEDIIVAADTLTLAVDSIVPEPDPNSQKYVCALFGTDNHGVRQKIQIMYTGESQYGTFTGNDFYNWDGSQGSGSFNYIRRADSDLGFYPFKKELTASVAATGTGTEIDVNGLINVWGKWTRVLAHAFIPAVVATDTVRSDLGVVSAIPNTFFNYLVMTAGNADYSLTFGLMGHDRLKAGTYYMADLLRPEFQTTAGDTILPAGAELTVTEADGGEYALTMSLLSQDKRLYLLEMHTGRMEMTDTLQVNCTSGQLTFNEMYDMYQFYGENTDYAVAVAVAPGVLKGQVPQIPSDSIQLTFTTVGHLKDMSQVRIFDAEASLAYDATNTKHITLNADLWGTDGVLYHVTMPVGWSIMPEAKDTIVVDCGEGVIRMDYSRGIGMLGLVVGNKEENTFANVVFYNGMHLGGTYYNEDFDYTAEPGMYVQTLVRTAEGYLNRLHDIKAAQLQVDSVGDTLHFMLDALVLNDTLYRFTATMGPKDVLTGEEKTYDVSNQGGYALVALQSSSPATQQQVYRLQLQRMDDQNEEGDIVGDAEIWDFYFLQQGWNGIKGTYGYSEGNLSTQAVHVIYEDDVEIYLAPVAGTLTFNPVEQISVSLSPAQTYKTWLYEVKAEFVAENGILYTLSGQNVLLCLDNETGELVELPEADWASLDAILQEKGLSTQKTFRNGRLLIETPEGNFTVGGLRTR